MSEIRLVAAPAMNIPLKVLVVDDHAAFRDALQELIEGFGHECRVARDGQEAWEMLENEPADVVLSDWQMPRMNGVELCRSIRKADGEGRYTYFVVLTGMTDKARFLRAMEAGADGCYAKGCDPNEVRAHLISAGRLVGLHRRAYQAARTDALTQIANRLRLDEDLNAVWSHAKRYRRSCSLAIADIDGFKNYNDHFGHLAGDDALRRIARTLRQEVREVDTVYRYGGEEFLLLLPEQSLASTKLAMDRVREVVEKLAIPSPSARGVVTVSVGVAELNLATDADPSAWIHRADGALYRAKALGRNRVEVDAR
ncbi:diguanylate cyclase [Pendulispora rubella]|uniref:diguanylate cyclase n=1 Tax=Pendulispora rubella TaxID=2741070 RepID=A0ABZ2LBP9_9BACT